MCEDAERTCDMCANFRPPIKADYPKGLCPYIMDEIGRKSTYAVQCVRFKPQDAPKVKSNECSCTKSRNYDALVQCVRGMHAEMRDMYESLIEEGHPVRVVDWDRLDAYLNELGVEL